MKNIFTLDTSNSLFFTHFHFWIFFTIVFFGLVLLNNKLAWRNAFLAFASLFLYYKTSGLFVLVLLFATIFNFFQGKIIHKAKHENKRKIHLIIGLIVNLFFLCYFKYSYFVTDFLNQLFATEMRPFDAFAWIGNVIAGEERFNVSQILLPVGISFFTFKNISYIVDVFKQRVEAVKKVCDFAFYVTFFPALVAGPIVRAGDFIPQIYKPFFLGRKQFGIAIFWILNGLVKKVVISDYIATNFVDRVFSNPTMYSGFENLFALFAYSLQLYADFSGYTDIAIGAAMIMGFYLPANFNSPYKALNPSDFWKRWHMTLSSWLKDYLYIPLGGNRSASWASYSVAIFICIITIILLGNIWIALIMFALVAISIFLMKTKLKLVTNIKQKIQQKIPTTIKQKLLITNSIKQKIDTNINLMNTMLIGGLWHGASWNFMIWGGLNGFGILLHRFWKNFSGDLYLSIFSGFTAILLIISSITNIPILNIAAVWSSIFCVQFIVLAYYIPEGKVKKYAERAFSIMQTFVFISFTRLFFRSGSGMNIDPTQASSIAWETTKSMISQIGSSWNFPQIAEIIYQFKYLFLLIVVGMVIHWLPTNFKRRYRLIFAKLPVPVICILVVVTIFVIYQFATADLQSFIYFQF